LGITQLFELRDREYSYQQISVEFDIAEKISGENSSGKMLEDERMKRLPEAEREKNKIHTRHPMGVIP